MQSNVATLVTSWNGLLSILQKKDIVKLVILSRLLFWEIAAVAAFLFTHFLPI